LTLSIAKSLYAATWEYTPSTYLQMPTFIEKKNIATPQKMGPVAFNPAQERIKRAPDAMSPICERLPKMLAKVDIIRYFFSGAAKLNNLLERLNISADLVISLPP
jgi:hypothetical protein